MFVADDFAIRKCVHLKIKTENWSPLRSELHRRRLSIQETFNEFAALISQGDPNLLKILDKIVYKKNRERMESMLGTVPKEIGDARFVRPVPKENLTLTAKAESELFDMFEKVNPFNKGEE